jgi:hypothetical protein
MKWPGEIPAIFCFASWVAETAMHACFGGMIQEVEGAPSRFSSCRYRV